MQYKLKMVLYRLEDFSLATELPSRIKDNAGLYFIKCGKHILSPLEDASPFEYAQVCVRVRGGKGGFGSRLKAEGQRLSNPKRAGNYGECKDLEGRRLQDVRDAQQIQEYLEREPELKAKAEAERAARYKSILSGAVQKRTFTKKDEAYLKSKERAVENVEAAVNNLDLSKIIKNKK